MAILNIQKPMGTYRKGWTVKSSACIKKLPLSQVSHYWYFVFEHPQSLQKLLKEKGLDMIPRYGRTEA